MIDKFTCAHCGKTYLKVTTDADFTTDAEILIFICDDCFQFIFRRERPDPLNPPSAP